MSWLSRGLFLACAVCLGAAVFGAYRNPGLVTRITQKGVDYAADTVAWQLTKLAKGGVLLGSRNESYNGNFDAQQFSLSDMVIAKLEGVRLGAKINEDVGLKVSLRIAEIQLRGSLYYNYSFFRLPITNFRFAFNITLSNLSLNFTAVFDIDLRGAQRATMNATRCDASASPIKIDLGKDNDWLATLLRLSQGSTMEWLISKAICRNMEKTQFVLIDDTSRYLRMCIVGTCTLIIVLPFVAQPDFRKGYVEMAHAVEVVGQDGTRILSPFVPRPIRRIPDHRGMLAVYLSPYVANSMLYALYRSGRLAFRLTDKDLLAKLQDGCKGGFCLARFLGQHILNSRLEVTIAATSFPRVEMSANITTLTLQSDLTIKTTPDNSATSTLARFHTNVFITGRAYIDNNRLCFNATDDVAKQTGRQDFTSVGGGIGQILVKIIERKLFSKFSELGKVGIPLPEYANIRWENPSLISVDDAYVMTTDVAYSPNP